MTGYGCKLLERAVNGWNAWELFEMAGNCLNWLEMAEMTRKWL